MLYDVSANITTVNVTITDSYLWIIGLILGLMLILINLKAKMAVLWLASSICFIGLYFEPVLADTYYRAAIILVIIACWLAAFFQYKSKRASLG